MQILLRTQKICHLCMSSHLDKWSMMMGPWVCMMLCLLMRGDVGGGDDADESVGKYDVVSMDKRRSSWWWWS